MARRHALLGGVLTLFSLFIAVPALAEYLGPDRHVVQVVQARNPSGDYWTCTNRLPPPGVNGTCVLQNPSNPCPDAGGHHPSREQQSAWCLWGTNYQDWGGCGCTAAYTTRTVETDLPEATIAAEVQGCAAVNGWCSTAATMHLTGSEPLAGESILAVEGTRSGEPFACSGTSCDVPLVEGPNAFTYWAISTFGDSSRMGVTDAQLDSIPPVLSADAAATPGDNGWWASAVSVTAAASDAAPGSGLASLEVMLGGVWVPYGGPVSMGEGVHEIRVRAVDGVGHTAEVAYTLRVDTTPPGCSVDDPGGAWLTGAVTVAGMAGDSGSGPGRVEVSTDGGGAWASLGPLADGSWSLGWDTRSGPDGVHVLLAQCWDIAGNGTVSELLRLSIDNRAPWIEMPERWDLGQSAALAIEERGSGLAGVRIAVDGGVLGGSTQTFDDSTGFPASVGWDGAFDGVSAPPGEYAVTVEAWDAVGNRGEAGGVVVVPLPQSARTQAPPPTAWRASTATLVPRTATPILSGSVGAWMPLLPGRLASPTARAARVVPLAPVVDPGSTIREAPTQAPGGNGALWGAAGLAAAAVATAYALSRKDERRKELEATLRNAAEAAARAESIRRAADVSRSIVAALSAGSGVAGSKPRARMRPANAVHEPDAGVAAHNEAADLRMVRIDERLVAEDRSLQQEERQAVAEARHRQLAEAARGRRAEGSDSQAFLGATRPVVVPLGEWRGLSAEERAGIAEAAEQDRRSGLRALASTIGIGLAEVIRRPKRNAERAEEEAQVWRESLFGAEIVRRGELSPEDWAEVVEQTEMARERWRSEVYALSASPPAGLRRANADLGVADEAQAREAWLDWQADVRRLTELPPLQLGRVLSGQSGAALGREQMDALRALLLQPTNTARQPTLSTWRLAGEVTGRGLELLAMELLDITPWQRNMVGGVGLAETRSVGPAAMLVFDMTYYNRVIDDENSYWSGYYAAARGFADLGSAYDLVDEEGGRTYDGRDFAGYLQDSLEGQTRQNQHLLFSSGRWGDPQVRWAFTHRAAAVAAQDLGWRVIAGYRMAEFLGEDVAFFLNDEESAWWTYQQALMDAGVLHYETTDEQVERYARNVRSAILEQVPAASGSAEVLDLEVRNRLAGLEMVHHPDPNTLDGVMDLARLMFRYGNQYASNPNAVDLVEFSRLRPVGLSTQLVVPRYEARIYSHADSCVRAAEQGHDTTLATQAEYAAHRISYVGLLNTAGNYPYNAAVSLFWPGSDPNGFVEYATPFLPQ